MLPYHFLADLDWELKRKDIWGRDLEKKINEISRRSCSDMVDKIQVLPGNIATPRKGNGLTRH